jgi:hypothetical protein
LCDVLSGLTPRISSATTAGGSSFFSCWSRVSDDFVPGLGGELDDAGTHRANAEDADSMDAVRVH